MFEILKVYSHILVMQLKVIKVNLYLIVKNLKRKLTSKNKAKKTQKITLQRNVYFRLKRLQFMSSDKSTQVT